MNFAYGWAFSQPVRKLFYNITVTGLSVVVALVIGSIELLGVLDIIERRQPQPRRLSRGRPVRADLGARARGLALRPDRAALERRHPPAVTTARPSGPRWTSARPRTSSPRCAPRATACRRRRRACSTRCSPPTGPCPRTTSRARTRASSGRRSTATSSAWRRSAWSATSTSATGPGLYALARGADREYLCCDRCGRVTTVDPAALDAVRAALHADFGHHAKFSHFPIHGLCASCADGPARPDAARRSSTSTSTATAIRPLAPARARDRSRARPPA